MVNGLLDLASIVGEIREQVEIIDSYAEELDSLPPLPDETPEPGRIQPGTETPQVDQVLAKEILEFKKKQPVNTIIFSPGCPGVPVAIDQRWLVRLLRHLLKNATRVIGNESNQKNTTSPHKCSTPS